MCSFICWGSLPGLPRSSTFFRLYHSGSDHLAARKKASQSSGKGLEIDAASVEQRDQEFPRERFCPLCRAVLTKYEVLYASSVEIPGGTKIRIHGCRYCYRPAGEDGAEDTQA